MHPTLFRIGNFEVTTFGLMMFLAFIVGSWILSLQLKRRDLDPDIAWDAILWIAVGGIFGAKAYYIALHVPDLMANPVRELTSRGGLVWYGGFIGGVTAYYLYIRRHKLPLAHMFDATAPALAIAYATGRVGCFLVGDDYGLPTHAWYGIAFPKGSPPSTAGYFRSLGVHIPATVPNNAVLAVHPTQLYEIFLGLVMFAILWKLSKRVMAPGRLFAVFMVLYAIERFFIEFVRAKGDRYVFGLSTSQVASILLVALAAYIWQRTRDWTPAAATTAATGGGDDADKPSAARH
ncbi:MAG: prolipoprotein diacylglyceryl transferase [Gemmatimonadota bacterium]|jgi:phosphatidylglycerol---prolipoprotein diacylglyceryl transferase